MIMIKNVNKILFFSSSPEGGGGRKGILFVYRFIDFFKNFSRRPSLLREIKTLKFLPGGVRKWRTVFLKNFTFRLSDYRTLTWLDKKFERISSYVRSFVRFIVINFRVRFFFTTRAHARARTSFAKIYFYFLTHILKNSLQLFPRNNSLQLFPSQQFPATFSLATIPCNFSLAIIPCNLSPQRFPAIFPFAIIPCNVC